MPSTKGKVLSEKDIRAFIKCSEFYHRGGTDEDPFGLLVVREAVESVLILALKDKLKDPLQDIHGCLLRAIAKINQRQNLLEPQLNKYLSSCMLWLKDFFEIIDLKNYEIVIGPIEPTVIVSKTPIKLRLPGTLRSKKNQTIHSIAFTPYSSKHSILNDPLILIRILLLKRFVKKHLQSNRPQVVLHLFAYTKSHNLEYYSIDSNSITKEHNFMLESILKGMEDGIHFPILPCNYKCPFKQSCFIGKMNVQ